MPRTPQLTLAVTLLLVSAGPTASAQPLEEVFNQLLGSSSRAAAAQSDADMVRDRADESYLRSWRPNIEISAEVGQQHYNTDTTVDPEFSGYDRISLRATQLVYDFGRKDSEVAEARTVAEQNQVLADSTAQGVLLDGLSAHWSVISAQKVLDFARESEEKVRNQTSLESSMVELGKGYESDVLQAKVQLATAEARRNRAEGALEIAQARVTAVFGELAPEVSYERASYSRVELIPQSLDEAKQLALENNKQIQVGVYRSQAIRSRMSRVYAQDFRPFIQMVGEYARRDDMDGTPGQIDDAKVSLQLQYNFNAANAGDAAVSTVANELRASEQREKETLYLVLEQVTVAWRNLMVARNNRNVLQNQVNIASHYLQMATDERQIGRRTLLDLLSAEMSLINAQSDLTTTEADQAIASLTLLQAIGLLDLDSIEFRAITSGN
ncbi:MAG: TolC family protein [Gammaproteobacteria bacterium]|nr:TolC family protein [Gammaproteobacteria bacterium]